MQVVDCIFKIQTRAQNETGRALFPLPKLWFLRKGRLDHFVSEIP